MLAYLLFIFPNKFLKIQILQQNLKNKTLPRTSRFFGMAYLCKDSAKFSVSRFCFYVSIDIKFTTSRLRQNSIFWLKSKLLSTEFIKFMPNGKVLRCEIPSPEVITVSLVMPTSYPRYGMFNLLLTLVGALMLKGTVGKTLTLRYTDIEATFCMNLSITNLLCCIQTTNIVQKLH